MCVHSIPGFAINNFETCRVFEKKNLRLKIIFLKVEFNQRNMSGWNYLFLLSEKRYKLSRRDGGKGVQGRP